MASYADKPWLKSYKLGPFKLKKTIAYPKKPLFAILDEAGAIPRKRNLSLSGEANEISRAKTPVGRLCKCPGGSWGQKRRQGHRFSPNVPPVHYQRFCHS